MNTARIAQMIAEELAKVVILTYSDGRAVVKGGK